jgi:hypothetical protein
VLFDGRSAYRGLRFFVCERGDIRSQEISVRLTFAVVLILELVACCRPAAAQNWPSDFSATPPATFASPGYASPLSPTVAKTKYDEQQQSVFIVDEPRSPNVWQTGASASTGRVYPASATMSVGGPPALVYEPGQQFQMFDSPQLGPSASGRVYNTIDAPVLPPGAILPEECIDYSCEPWHWQLLPQGLIWHSYLAGPKEPRLEALVFSGPNLDTKFDGMVGGRVGLLRYGNSADFRPQGWQLDVEGAALIREDVTQDQDVDGYDFRVGIPVTYGVGNYMMKISWYHTSAHIGDEFMLKHPNFERLNYSRNAIVWGHAYYLTEAIRVYGEIDYGYFVDGGNKPWAFQFGWEYSPVVRGAHGAPFLAMNAYLREENDFGGFYTLQTGWQWRGARGGQLVRVGFHYQTGPSTLNEFFDRSEEQIGAGLWYDF